MNVPTAVARSLQRYINSGGAENMKATIMLHAMGWMPDGTRAPDGVVKQARDQWGASDSRQETLI